MQGIKNLKPPYTLLLDPFSLKWFVILLKMEVQ